MTTTTARKDAAATQSENAHGEPLKLRKRIGSTLYIVTAYPGSNATETMEDKLLRLIESEANKIARLSINPNVPQTVWTAGKRAV
jgi:hypothetical protein